MKKAGLLLRDPQQEHHGGQVLPNDRKLYHRGQVLSPAFHIRSLPGIKISFSLSKKIFRKEMHDEKENLRSISGPRNVFIDAPALLGTAISATEFTTVAAIISAFSAINYPSSPYTTSTAITDANTRAIGATWKSSLRLQNSDHELWAESSLSTQKSSLATNVSTYAATEWAYDVFYGAGSIVPQFSNVTLSASGSYLSNMK